MWRFPLPELEADAAAAAAAPPPDMRGDKFRPASAHEAVVLAEVPGQHGSWQLKLRLIVLN